MKLRHVKVDGRTLSIDERIGKGGEGEIYRLKEDRSLALKVYTIADIASREQKISAMVGQKLSQKSSLVTFPISTALSPAGAFVGFVMRLVEGHKPLHELYAPGSRKLHFPQADYRFLVRTATNTARSVASVHRAGCVVGDINHSSMLISPKAVVALIDADSFQLSAQGQQFLCKVGVPEYTPPELQGVNLSKIVRTENHDAFGLAVVIFQILFMGRHPFAGKVRHGETPPLHESIKTYKYVYTESRDVGMDQPPGTPSLSDFSKPVADAFEAAFSKASAARPKAEAWVTILETLEGSLEKCDANPLHYVPRAASGCPWCDMENELSTILFLPYFASNQTIHTGADPGAANFDVDRIWLSIEAIKIPNALQPKLASVHPAPSAEAVSAKPGTSFSGGAVVGIIGSIIGFVAVPQLFIFWLPLIIWGFSNLSSNKPLNASPFFTAYETAESRWNQELSNWGQRIGLQFCEELKKELYEAKEKYKALLQDEKVQIQKYRTERRERHLNAFLDRYAIAAAKIRGIGPSKQAVLASYGIDTAADVVLGRLLSVPGFGDVNTKPLLSWRAGLERGFIYPTNENEQDRLAIAKISAAVQAKLPALRQKLNSGRINLASAVTRVQSATQKEDPALNLSNARLAQAKADLEFLGIAIPAPRGATPTNRPLTPTTVPAASSVGMKCPRCGSAMVRRLAKRGSYRGSHFWGCSRYPQCKGTRR